MIFYANHNAISERPRIFYIIHGNERCFWVHFVVTEPFASVLNTLTKSQQDMRCVGYNATETTTYPIIPPHLMMLAYYLHYFGSAGPQPTDDRKMTGWCTSMVIKTWAFPYICCCFYFCLFFHSIFFLARPRWSVMWNTERDRKKTFSAPPQWPSLVAPRTREKSLFARNSVAENVSVVQHGSSSVLASSAQPAYSHINKLKTKKEQRRSCKKKFEWISCTKLFAPHNHFVLIWHITMLAP